MNQAPLNIFKQLAARTKVRLIIFERQTTAAKVNVVLFSVHQQISKMFLVYLEFELHQHRFG